MATHPVVGVWRLANDPNDPANVAVGAFHADGIYVGVASDIGTGLWAWRATGDRTADATGLAHDTAEHDNLGGTVKIWMAIEVDATGNALTAAVFVHVLDPWRDRRSGVQVHGHGDPDRGRTDAVARDTGGHPGAVGAKMIIAESWGSVPA